MKKVKKEKLVLDKKVVAKLTDADVRTMKGGINVFTRRDCDKYSPLCVTN